MIDFILKTLIVEDQSDIANDLIRKLTQANQIEVIQVADDGEKAIQYFEEYKPKVVIIDIDIPKKNGLEVAKHIFDMDPFTYLVFCTGFSNFMGEAFDVYAFDYLVKPVQKERLLKTISRIVQIEKSKKTEIKETRKRVNKLDGERFIIREGTGYFFLNVNDIIFITKENRRTIIHHIDGKHYVDENMSVLEEKLKGLGFIRTHKGFIVNIEHVNKVIPFSRNAYNLEMFNTLETPLLTWSRLKELEKKMGIN